jgi:hypothetical protein
MTRLNQYLQEKKIIKTTLNYTDSLIIQTKRYKNQTQVHIS